MFSVFLGFVSGFFATVFYFFSILYFSNYFYIKGLQDGKEPKK